MWPARAPDRKGWRRVGFEGPRAECEAHIEEVWTRPLSLRKAIDKFGTAEQIPEEVWTDMRP